MSSSFTLLSALCSAVPHRCMACVCVCVCSGGRACAEARRTAAPSLLVIAGVFNLRPLKPALPLRRASWNPVIKKTGA